MKNALLITLMLITFARAGTAPQAQGISYPVPSGAYPVGRSEYHWVDASRPEIYAAVPGRAREVSVTVWYPAKQTAELPPAPWINPDLARGYEAQSGASLPAMINAIRVRAHADVPVAAAGFPFPALVMSHGSGMLPELYTTTAEALASHGYVVFGVSHPYNAWATLLSDGKTVLQSPAADPVQLDLPANATPLDIAEAADARGTRLLAVQTDDLRFVVDQIEQLNRTDARFKGRLNMARVGVFGHSFGGATALTALLSDSRFGAAAVIDSSLFSDVTAAVNRPVLGIYADATLALAAPSNADISALGLPPEAVERVTRTMQRVKNLFSHAQNASLVEIAQAAHMNFTDAGLLSEVLPGLADQLGAIDPMLALAITNDYLVAFFDMALKDSPSRLRDLLAQYPQSRMVSGN